MRATRHTTRDCPGLERIEQFVTRGETDGDVRDHIASCTSCTEQVEMVRENNDLFTDVLRLTERGLTGGVGETATAPPPDLAAHGYEIVETISTGGQGVVYRAVQTATRRQVAVKMLHRSALASERRRRRFEGEIEMVAALRHPNIVTVYDSGALEDGRHFLVMELIDGSSLSGSAPLQRPGGARGVVALIAKVTDAVCAAHQRGIIHRDLKPSNVLLDRDGEPHVVDFGVAKATGARAMLEATQSGEFLGTIAWAAPEQVSGDPAQIDTRTDVYALGMLLYACLTGQRPYPCDGSVTDVIRAITEGEPRPPSSINPKVGGELETIVLKALAKDPARRYQSAGALHKDLHHYLAGEPIDAKRDSALYVIRKTLRRHLIPTVFSAVILLLILGAAIGAMALYRDARLEAEKANTIRVFLEDTFASVEPVAGGHDVTLRETLDEAVHWVDVALSGRPEIDASVRITIGNSYRALGLFADADRQLESALGTYRRVRGDRHPDVAAALNAMGLLRSDQGRHADAERLLREGLDIRRSAYGQESLVVSSSLMNLGRLTQLTGDLNEAADLYRQSYAIRSRALGESHPDSAMSLYRLAEIQEQRGELGAAARTHRRVLDTRRERLHPGHPDLARSQLALGTLLLRQGEAVDAERVLRDGSGSAESFGWRRLEVESLRGECLAALGRYDDAEAVLLACYASLRDDRSPAGDATRVTARRLANLYESMGRAEDAAAWRLLAADAAPSIVP